MSEDEDQIVPYSSDADDDDDNGGEAEDQVVPYEEGDDDDDDDEESEGAAYNEDGERIPREGMSWINEPDEWMQHRTTVVLRVKSGTEFWREVGGVDGDVEEEEEEEELVRDNAPFYFLEVEGNFEVRCKVKAEYDNEGDQAGIMIREDEENWIKCGIQIIDDVPHMCATFTRKYSDMSMHPLPHLPEFMWVHAKKIGDGLEVYISEDSFDWMQIRQGDIPEEGILQIGVYAASPNSGGGKRAGGEGEDGQIVPYNEDGEDEDDDDDDEDGGFEVEFQDFMVKGED